jgi:hypothetical protein
MTLALGILEGCLEGCDETCDIESAGDTVSLSETSSSISP